MQVRESCQAGEDVPSKAFLANYRGKKKAKRTFRNTA